MGRRDKLESVDSSSGSGNGSGRHRHHHRDRNERQASPRRKGDHEDRHRNERRDDTRDRHRHHHHRKPKRGRSTKKMDKGDAASETVVAVQPSSDHKTLKPTRSLFRKHGVEEATPPPLGPLGNLKASFRRLASSVRMTDNAVTPMNSPSLTSAHPQRHRTAKFWVMLCLAVLVLAVGAVLAWFLLTKDDTQHVFEEGMCAGRCWCGVSFCQFSLNDRPTTATASTGDTCTGIAACTPSTQPLVCSNSKCTPTTCTERAHCSGCFRCLGHKCMYCGQHPLFGCAC